MTNEVAQATDNDSPREKLTFGSNDGLAKGQSTGDPTGVLDKHKTKGPLQQLIEHSVQVDGNNRITTKEEKYSSTNTDTDNNKTKNLLDKLLKRKEASQIDLIAKGHFRSDALSLGYNVSSNKASQSFKNASNTQIIDEIPKLYSHMSALDQGSNFSRSTVHIRESIRDQMVLALPLLGFLISIVLFCFIVHYCRKLFKGDKKNAKNQSGRLGAAFSNPLGLIVGGKVISRVQVLGKGQDGKLDNQHLTINMEDEGNCIDDNLNKKNTSKKKKQSEPSPMDDKQAKQTYGRIKYKLSYDFNQNRFSVTVIRAENLPSMDIGGSSDPYVKVYLMPDSRVCNKTRVQKRCLNPEFNETFNYDINYAELMTKTLLLAVYDYDRFSAHDEIGQVSVAIKSVDLSQVKEEWCDLERITDANSGQLGDLCLSLRYVPTAGRLTVVILEGRKLKKMDLAGLSDPYVKLVLISDGKRIKKKKTSIKKCTLNPHFNESFSFDIPFELVQKVQLVLTVVDYDRIGTSEPIGKLVLGCENPTGESELRHWMDMLACPRRVIAQWHTLKDLKS